MLCETEVESVSKGKMRVRKLERVTERETLVEGGKWERGGRVQ